MKLRLHVLMLAWLLVAQVAFGQAAAPAQSKLPESLSATEFSRLSRELSEDGGFFPSDNFTSNETSYLTVTDKLRQLNATGGAYIGVGPEQNFSYIARVRPRVAFIVDIRRQAIIQHLLYKAIFQLAPTRGQFLSMLLSRPYPKDKTPKADAPLNDLLTALSAITADEKFYADNLAAIKKAITTDFQFSLNEADTKSLEYVYSSFRDSGFEIGFRLNRGGGGGGFNGPPPGGFRGGGGGFGRFPSFKELLAQTDLNGKQGNFLASVDDYEFVRGLHRKHLVIPVVGDFAGKKALAAVADTLRKWNVTVTAFYTSNVEMVLFQNGIYDGWAANVKKLPITDRSLIIRAAFSRYSHPARLEGHSTFTLLQLIPAFVKDYDAGKHGSYVELIAANYIAADKPAEEKKN
jgi:hypothetical protein